MSGIPDESGKGASNRRVPGEKAAQPAEPAQPVQKEIEIEEVAEAGSPETEVTPSAEVAPAGASPPQQPVLDLSGEIIRPWEANRTSLHETRDIYEFTVGPMEVRVYIAERAEDTSAQAVSTSMLRFTFSGVAAGVLTATAGQVLASPTGADMLFIGGGVGSAFLLLGVGVNAYRVWRRKR